MSLPQAEDRIALPRHRGWTRQAWAREQKPVVRPRSWDRVDVPLLASTAALCLVGWLALHSAGSGEAWRQLAYAVGGGTLALVAAFTNPARTRRLAWPLYLLSLGLLALVMVPGVGQSAKGAQRWLSLGPVGFQPSELAKLALIVILARVLAPGATRLRVLLALILSGVSFVLIALQPDLGTALVLGAICLVTLFVGGVSPVVLAGLVTVALAVIPYGLKEYQRNRLLVFLHPEVDPRGLGYSLTQSKTAIGSGQWMGHGLHAGHMTQHGFVPENWTDFIFSVMGEEMGFLGCAGFLALALLLCGCLLKVAWQSRDRFGQLLTTGVLAMLGFQFLVNMAMTTGAAPVVGIPLPFASYGGSALVVNLVSVGLVLAVSARARKPREPWED